MEHEESTFGVAQALAQNRSDCYSDYHAACVLGKDLISWSQVSWGGTGTF